MHSIYNGIGLALCGVALLMILVAYLKKKNKKMEKDKLDG